MAFSWQLALAGLIAAATHAQGGGKPPASVYVDTACINYSAAYKPLVTSYLSQYRSGFSTAELLQMPTAYNGSRLQAEFQGALPVVYLLDGKIWLDTSLPQPGGKRLKNMEYFGIPLLQQLAQLTGVATWCSTLMASFLLLILLACSHLLIAILTHCDTCVALLPFLLSGKGCRPSAIGQLHAISRSRYPHFL